MKSNRRITDIESLQRIGTSAFWSAASGALYLVATTVEPRGFTLVRVAAYSASGFCGLCGVLALAGWIQFLTGRRSFANDATAKLPERIEQSIDAAAKVWHQLVTGLVGVARVYIVATFSLFLLVVLIVMLVISIRTALLVIGLMEPPPGGPGIFPGVFSTATLVVFCVISGRRSRDVVTDPSMGKARVLEAWTYFLFACLVFALIIVATTGVFGFIAIAITTSLYELFTG